MQLSLLTMHAEDKIINSYKVTGLLVCGFDIKSRIQLPIVFSRNIVPANRSHIPTPDTAKLWPHLEPTAKDLIPLKQCEIGLLIEYN